MKPSTILPFLLGLATALPVALIFKSDAVAHHHFAPMTRIHPSAIEEDVDTPIDNRPQSPSASDIPSVVLASPKPIQSTYLMGLPSTSNNMEKPALEDNVASKVAAAKAGVAASVTDSHGGHKTQAHAARPCASRRVVDISVICFVLLFLVIVAAIESTDSIRKWSCRSENTSAGGAIRLDTEAGIVAYPLSIQAYAYSYEDESINTEKTRL